VGVGCAADCAAAGLLFTTSATIADGTTLRDDRRPQLAQLIADKRNAWRSANAKAAELRAAVDEETAELAKVDRPVLEHASARRACGRRRASPR
jgi:hypothetical protein